MLQGTTYEETHTFLAFYHKILILTNNDLPASCLDQTPLAPGTTRVNDLTWTGLNSPFENLGNQ